MISELLIGEWAEEGLKGTDKFVLDIKIRKGNRILVTLDGDNGVTIDDCVRLSRFLEGKLDRDTEDFELEVSTGGADQPLRLFRQYPKHVGRQLKVNLKDGTLINGDLLSVSPAFLELRLLGEKTGTKQTTAGGFIQKIDFEQIAFSTIVLRYD